MARNSIFKAYDVRGFYPSEINEDEVYRISQAYAEVLKPKTVIVGRDGRKSGPALARSVCDGLADAGVDVFDMGLAPTDMFYYAVGKSKVDGGIFVSASHNPAEWNGLNFCAHDAVPLSVDYLLPEIERQTYQRPLGKKTQAGRKGERETLNVLPEYLEFLAGFIRGEISALKIAADANFSPQAKIFRALIDFKNLPLELRSINAETDVNFPKGAPNPLLAERQREITALVKKEKADFGLAWDGDGDRCFFVDERGVFHDGYFTTAILAREILKDYPGAKIFLDPRLTWATTDAVREAGGTAVITAPGMTRMALKVREADSPFGGELSAHFYFRENYWRDSGILPVLVICRMLSRDRQPLSSYYLPFEAKYFASPEINFEVDDPQPVLAKIEKRYKDAKIEHIDGLSVEYADWRFNLRPSHTEALLRLNLEARSAAILGKKLRELEELIKSSYT